MPDQNDVKPTIQFGSQIVTVDDPLNVQPVPADVIVDLRIVNDVVWLSLGHFVIDGNAHPRAVVNTRLRLTMPTVLDIQNGIQRALADLESAKKNAN